MLDFRSIEILRNSAPRPTKPDPNSASEMGSGTVEALSPPKVSAPTSVFVTALVTGTSGQGQPRIPKHITKIHKIINNNFFK
jgi:hypothetical protein